MGILTEIEKGLFLSLFNRGGYVLDFSTNDFDNFTLSSIGIALCKRYNLSKGKSLTEYCGDGNSQSVAKLLIDLYDHYRLSRLIERDQIDYPEYYSMYTKLTPIVDRIRSLVSNSTSKLLLNPVKEIFNSDYISDQIDSMIELETINPTDCIGKAKELIESCCITIMENLNFERDKNWDINKLVSETTNLLNLSPKEIKDSLALSKTIKSILQSLRTIAVGIAELRNPYGAGHGKSANYKGLQTRHAKLAVGASATRVNFLWESYLLQSEFCPK